MPQCGKTWLLRHIQHTAGIYGCFSSLAQVARKEPEHELSWWETGPACERRIMCVAQVRLKYLPQLVLWTTTEVLLNEYGPLAGIWLQHIPQSSQEGLSGTLLRRKIFALVSAHRSS